MRMLKILMLSAALAAFGAGAALAQPAPVATTPGDTVTTPKANVTKKKIVKKKVVKKHYAKHKVTKKKIVTAKVVKKKPAPPTDNDTAPGNPSSNPN